MPELRQPGEAQVEQILTLVRDYYFYDGHKFDQDCSRQALTQLIRNPELGRVWLIYANQQIAGYIILTFGFSLEFHGRDAFVDEFFLCEQFRGQGLGRWALDQVEEAARQMGVRAVHLEVVRENESANDFYRRHGYQDHDRVLMTKWLK